MSKASLKSLLTLLERLDADGDLSPEIDGEYFDALRDAIESPSPVVMPDEVREAVMDAIAEALGDAYDCTRVWGAWSYGTMGPSDFVSVAGQADRLAEIADAAIAAYIRSLSSSAPVEALPEGCPETLAFGPYHNSHRTVNGIHVHVGACSFPGNECSIVEIHPVGTRARLSRLERGNKENS